MRQPWADWADAPIRVRRRRRVGSTATSSTRVDEHGHVRACGDGSSAGNSGWCGGHRRRGGSIDFRDACRHLPCAGRGRRRCVPHTSQNALSNFAGRLMTTQGVGLCLEIKKRKFHPARDRTWNLRFRRPTPYPLGHEAPPDWKSSQQTNKFLFNLVFAVEPRKGS